MSVGIVYDPRMCAHSDPSNKFHPEEPGRISAIWDSLEESGVLNRCVRVEAREATVEELATVHTEAHIDKMVSVSKRSFGKQGRAALARRYNSIYFNEGSSQSALLAAGSVVELSLRVAKGELASGAAIVRPPGHHAEADEAMGFCLFNNVAVAAHLLANGKVAGPQKVLIVDWDVHHGNGTQHMFWQDPNVLYFSVHRYDNGFFYPVSTEGDIDKVGGAAGAGFNINVPWPGGGYGDADYIAVWEYVLMPVAKEFNPDIVLISGGFDSAIGDPLGGCNVTPFGYSVLTQKLMELAGGKLVLALEGGYNLISIAQSYLACVQVLLGDVRNETYSTEAAYESTWTIIQKVRQELSAYWPVLSESIAPPVSNPSSPHEEIESSDEEELGSNRNLLSLNEEIVELLEKMTMEPDSFPQGGQEPEAVVETTRLKEPVRTTSLEEPQVVLETTSWKEPEAVLETTSLKEPEAVLETTSLKELEAVLETTSLKKPYVWYATYGSNMWLPRLMCYIQGGKAEGSQRTTPGLEDKTPPLDDCWFSVPHRLFFGRKETLTWGAGGVAFLDPVASDDSESYLRAYKITLDQFNGIFFQENNKIDPKTGIELSLDNIDELRRPPYFLEKLEGNWYGTLLYLGEKDGLPVLTITCAAADAEKFKCGDLPICPPSAAYRNVISKALQQRPDEVKRILPTTTEGCQVWEF